VLTESVAIALIGELAKVAALEAAKAFSKKTTEYGTGAVLTWIEHFLKTKRPELSKEAREKVLHLVADEASFYDKIIAQLKVADRRGIMFVGPSGAGKSSLMNAITNRMPPELKSSTEIDTQFVILAKTLVAVHDVLGQHLVDAKAINESVERHRPTVLAVVMANGLLDTIGTGNELRRPYREPVPTMDDYLKATLQEELDWLEQFTKLVHVPSPPVKYVALVVNKMDHWLPDQSAVDNRYSAEGKIGQAMVPLVKKLAIPGQTCQVTYAAATYDAFKGLPTKATFNKQAAVDSVRVLKAFFTTLLLDGRV
jgi:hypothetical protein